MEHGMAKGDHEAKQSEKARTRTERRRQALVSSTARAFSRRNAVRDRNQATRNRSQKALITMLVTAALKGDREAAAVLRRQVEFIEEFQP
jgi:hypothetical protein